MMIEDTIVLQGTPITSWRPESEPRAVVLLGHGLGVDRFHRSNRLAAERFTECHQIAAIAPELPLHGELADPSQPDIVEAWQSFWSQGGIRHLLSEWLDHLAYVGNRFPDRPVGYFGLSLGTQYGIPFLAGQREVRAAVLGLFGSHPPPRTPVMNRFAPEVTCPVCFLQQLDDEIHPADTTDHLFESLGAEHKELESNPGLHADVPERSFNRAVDFLAGHLESQPGLR